MSRDGAVRLLDAVGLRVCHLGKYYPPAPGGIETHLQTLARGQSGLGAAVRVICVNHQDSRGRDVTWDAVARTPTVEEADGLVRLIRVGRWLSLARLDVCPALPAVLRNVIRSGIDLLHLHAPNPTMLLALAALRSSPPVVVTHHSDVVRQRFLQRVQAPFERRVYDRASLILTDSPAYAAGSDVLRRYGDKVRSLPLGIDLGPFQSPDTAARAHAERWRAEQGEPLWLMVGRLTYYKGIGIALRALVNVPGRLLVIGTGPMGRELRGQAGSLDVASRVIWHGHASLPELVGAYHAATALWFPSNARSEGFGLVQVEAMASGCPVINTAIPHSGVPWVSRHEETGLTVPVDDPAALAAAANRLLTEPGLRDRLAQGARRRAAQEFDQHAMARTCMDIYRGRSLTK